ncbi:MAG: hypothetical protein IPL78_30175 [Chloroflexi bacterium]|nr:hypothetical protein [Chloroflexota bacterium]
MNKRLPIKSAVIVEMGADSSATRTTLYEQRRKRRDSKRIRPFESVASYGEAQSAGQQLPGIADERSNRRKRTAG